jgi:GT2 family glycosyltransferase
MSISVRPLEERLGIVIVTRNRVDTLLSTIERLRALEAPYPIVVVDNASTDGTPAAVERQYPDIEVVCLPENLGGGARNYGVRRLERELIAFTDDDSWWEHGSLARAVELFDAWPTLGLAMSMVLAGPENRLDPCCELMSRSPLPKTTDTPGIPVLGFLACGVVFRRR